jgi:hypothetical protein
LSLENIPLEKITENNLQSLIDNKVQEGRRIEYKSNRPAIKDEEKKEVPNPSYIVRKRCRRRYNLWDKGRGSYTNRGIRI